jgi:hypothetical protein
MFQSSVLKSFSQNESLVAIRWLNFKSFYQNYIKIVKESLSNDLIFFMFELVENKSCPKDILGYFIKNEFNNISQDGKTISQIAKNKLNFINSPLYWEY